MIYILYNMYYILRSSESNYALLQNMKTNVSYCYLDIIKNLIISIFTDYDPMRKQIINSTFKEIWDFPRKKMFARQFSSFLFLNVLPLVKCFCNRNKWKSVCASYVQKQCNSLLSNLISNESNFFVTLETFVVNNEICEDSFLRHFQVKQSYHWSLQYANFILCREVRFP